MKSRYIPTNNPWVLMTSFIRNSTPIKKTNKRKITSYLFLFWTIPIQFFFSKSTFTSTARSSKWFLSLRFPHQNPSCIYFLHHTCTRPSNSYPQLPRLDACENKSIFSLEPITSVQSEQTWWKSHTCYPT
jgi:hypothetical protein